MKLGHPCPVIGPLRFLGRISRPTDRNTLRQSGIFEKKNPNFAQKSHLGVLKIAFLD